MCDFPLDLASSFSFLVGSFFDGGDGKKKSDFPCVFFFLHNRFALRTTALSDYAAFSDPNVDTHGDYNPDAGLSTSE